MALGSELRFFQRHFQGQYWPTMACHLIRSFGLLSMMGLATCRSIYNWRARRWVWR